MAAGLPSEFESWFIEALDTPPMQEPLRSLLGPQGDSPFAQQVLAGTASLQNMDIDGYARKLLGAMKRPAAATTLPQSRLHISSQEHQRDQWNRIRIMRKKIRGGEILQAIQVYHLSCPRS